MNPVQGRLTRIERISRQTRHHQIYENQIHEDRLRKRLDDLRDEYWRNIKRLKPDEILEKRRKQLLDVTIRQIAKDKQNQKFPKNNVDMSTEKMIRPVTENKCTSTKHPSCFISRTCRLYPCQPIHQYTSFMTKDNDRTLEQPKSTENNSSEDFRLHFKNFSKDITEIHHAGRRQLAVTMYNQYHLAHRREFIKRTMSSLNEQSRLLHERLTEKRFSYMDDYQNSFRKAIQRHLRSSARFYER